jgi:thioredoxin reductase
MKSKTKTPDSTVWDVIIVGAGPAGSNAAMVLARMRRNVLIIDDEHPRNQRSQGMHNYLSRDGMLPTEFLKLVHEELAAYHIPHIKAKALAARKLGDHGFEVSDSKGGTYLCKRLLIATGVSDNIPDIPGMKELWGKGVYHCPFCDGYELCDLNIGLYASRYNGFGMAIALKQLSSSVTLFTDGRGYLSSDQRRQLQGRDVKVVSAHIAELTCSNDELTCVTLRNGESVACDAVFVHHGHRVNNDLLIQLGARMSSKGAAITNRKQACSVPGLYVAGDATIDMHFVIVAAAEGAKAGVTIHDDLLHAENLIETPGEKDVNKAPLRK